PRLTASHTTPVTVLAELGIVGAACYLVLITAAISAAVARWRTLVVSRASDHSVTRAARTRRGWPEPSTIWASGALIAVFAHSMLYAGFFEDAVLWVALAVLASLPTDRMQGQQRPSE